MSSSHSQQDLLASLLTLPATPELLEQWLSGPLPDGMTRFQVLHSAIMAATRSDPAQALAAANHLHAARLRGLGFEERGALLRLRAHCLRAVGRAKEAAGLYERAWKHFAQDNDGVELGRVAIGWIDALALTGQLREALEVARRGRRVLPRNESLMRARLESNVGNAWWWCAGDFQKASEHYRKARTVFRRRGSTWDAAFCSYNLGNAGAWSGRLSQARRDFASALEAFREAGSRVLELRTEYALASLDLMEGRWDAALPELHRVRDELHSVGDAQTTAAIQRELAQLFSALGAFELAEPEAAAALKTYRQLGLRGEEAQAAFLHGRLLASLGRHHDARARWKRATSFWEGSGNRWAQRRTEIEQASSLLQTGQAQRALDLLRGARNLLERRDPKGSGARCRALMGEALLALGKTAQAEGHAEAAWKNARHHPTRWERPAIALLRARCAARRGDEGGAVRWARKSVGELETVLMRVGDRAVRTQIAGAREQLYGRAVELVLRCERSDAPAVALDLLSRARSAGLIEDLLRTRGRSFSPEVRGAIARLRDQLMTTEDPGVDDVRFRFLRSEIGRLERRLEAEPRPTSVVRRAYDARGLAEWRHDLGKRPLVLLDGSTGAWRAFVVEPGGHVQLRELPEAATALRRSWRPLRMLLEAAAHAPRQRRARLLQRTADEAQEVLDHLYRAFWQPLRLEASEIVLVPTGALHGVPLEAALESSLSTAPVVRRLPHPALLGRPRSSRRSEALLLRGPGTGTRQEVRAVQKLLEREGFDVTLGEDRTGLRQPAQPLGVLHVAAHGVFHRANWMLSGLQLRDGWLGFEQLEPRRVRGALLYFSSCESGLARELPGAELDGWISAGLGAQAAELIMTLWKLDDEAAQGFATAFYGAWTQGRGAATAAAEARRSLRAAGAHPFAWAPFVSAG